jgi:hypothetical protein
LRGAFASVDAALVGSVLRRKKPNLDGGLLGLEGTLPLFLDLLSESLGISGVMPLLTAFLDVVGESVAEN